MHTPTTDNGTLIEERVHTKVTDVYYSDHDAVLCSIPLESVSLTTWPVVHLVSIWGYSSTYLHYQVYITKFNVISIVFGDFNVDIVDILANHN